MTTPQSLIGQIIALQQHMGQQSYTREANHFFGVNKMATTWKHALTKIKQKWHSNE